MGLFLLQGQVFAADDIEVIISRHARTECRLTTFEGAPDYQPINPDLDGLIPELNARFDSGWYTLIYGSFSNNPSPPTIAFWVDYNNYVTFEEPVAAVSFYYSSPVRILCHRWNNSRQIFEIATLLGDTGGSNTLLSMHHRYNVSGVWLPTGNYPELRGSSLLYVYF